MFGNPYQAIYNPYVAMYGYTAPLGAYQVMYGASDSRHKKYKKMLHLMAKLIRTRKKYSRAGSDDKRERLKAEIKMLRKHIAHLRSQLQSEGVDTSQAENEATAVEASAPDDGSDDVTSSRTMRPRKHRTTMHRGRRGRGHVVRRMGSMRRKKSRKMYPHGMKRVKGRQGIRTSAVRHHKYALRKRHARGIRGAYHQHKARLPGQRQFDGRRRQGPISASEVQQAPIAQDVDANDDGMIDNAMAMDPNVMPSMVATDIPDIDFETAPAPDGLIDSAADAADEALSGVLDFADNIFGGNRGITYGVLGGLLGFAAMRFGAWGHVKRGIGRGVAAKQIAAATVLGAVGGYGYGRNR